MRKLIFINGQSDLRILRQCLELRSFWRRRHYDLAAVPVKPDWDDAWCSVGTNIGQACRNFRSQHLLRCEMLQETQISLLNWLHTPSSYSAFGLYSRVVLPFSAVGLFRKPGTLN